jgi:hypothetical protein
VSVFPGKLKQPRLVLNQEEYDQLKARVSTVTAGNVKVVARQPTCKCTISYGAANWARRTRKPDDLMCGLSPARAQPICPNLSRGGKCAITRFDENRDYILDHFLERLQLFKVCQNMLKPHEDGTEIDQSIEGDRQKFSYF